MSLIAGAPFLIGREHAGQSGSGCPLLMTRSAMSTAAPSPHPPETLPEISPRSLIAILVPSGRGAERMAPATMAIAMRSPRSAQRVTLCSVSFIARAR